MKIVFITPASALRRMRMYRLGGKIYGQSNAPRAYELADWIHEKTAARVIIGGMPVSLYFLHDIQDVCALPSAQYRELPIINCGQQSGSMKRRAKRTQKKL